MKMMSQKRQHCCVPLAPLQPPPANTNANTHTHTHTQTDSGMSQKYSWTSTMREINVLCQSFIQKGTSFCHVEIEHTGYWPKTNKQNCEQKIIVNRKLLFQQTQQIQRFWSLLDTQRASLMAQMVMNLPAMQKTWVLSLGSVPWRKDWLPLVELCL